MVWIISPAHTSRAKASANCPTTSVSRSRNPPRDSPPRPPSLSDSCNGTLLLRSAGAKPNNIPAAIDIPAVNNSRGPLTANPSPACSGTICPNTLQHAWPTHRPRNPPTTESIKLSVSNCEAICHRDAPIARRTAISLLLPVERASNKLAKFEQAISSTNREATCSTSSPLPAAPAYSF